MIGAFRMIGGWFVRDDVGVFEAFEIDRALILDLAILRLAEAGAILDVVAAIGEACSKLIIWPDTGGTAA